jgi:hypothetical protein
MNNIDDDTLDYALKVLIADFNDWGGLLFPRHVLDDLIKDILSKNYGKNKKN